VGKSILVKLKLPSAINLVMWKIYRAVKFAYSIGFGQWQIEWCGWHFLSSDWKWPRLTKYTHSVFAWSALD